MSYIYHGHADCLSDRLAGWLVGWFRFRKIVQYVNFSGNTGDVSYGHGSHVCGTLAGYCLNTCDSSGSGLYHGAAPSAKIAVRQCAVHTRYELTDICVDSLLCFKATTYDVSTLFSVIICLFVCLFVCP